MGVPELSSGSLHQWRQARWAEIYERRLANLGASATILPFGDPAHGKIDGTSYTTVARSATGIVATFTSSSAIDSWTDPLTYEGTFEIPILSFDEATPDELDSPDNNYWSRDDSSGEGMSWIGWVNLVDSANQRVFLSKYSTGAPEWIFQIVGTEKLRLVLIDGAAAPNATADNAMSTGVWLHCAIVYDGSGGASAMGGVTVYVDGASVAVTANNNGSYVNMDNTTGLVNVGHYASSGIQLPCEDKIAGGPLGMAWTPDQLTAAQVLNDYRLTAPALGVLA